jgi:hypothetical protein
MRTRLVVGLAFGALGIVTVACSSSSSGSSNPYPDVQHFCSAVAAAECGSKSSGTVVNCSLSGSVDTTLSDCESFRQSECEKGSIVVPFPGSDSATSRTYTSANVQPCIDAINNALNSSGAMSNGVAVLTYDQLFGMGNLVDTCEQVFLGSAATGATCKSDFDCTNTGDICAPDPLGQTGPTCATPRPTSIGNMCRDTGDTCTNGFCSSKAVCVALLADGQTCTADGQCQASSHCIGGTCAARGGSGAACASNNDCDPTIPLFCDVYRPGGAVCAKTLLLGSGAPDCSGFLLGQGLVLDGGSSSSSGSSSGSGSGSGSSSGGGDSGAETGAGDAAGGG